MNGTTQICQAFTHNYPIKISSASGVLADDTLIVCGGSDENDEENTVGCYYFDHRQKWTKLGDTTAGRGGSGSIAIPNGAWITGK